MNSREHLRNLCNDANRRQSGNCGRSTDYSGVINFFVGALCVLFGLGLIGYGIYLGIVPMLVGGIVQIIDGAKMNPTDAHMIGWGIAKAVFFEVPIILGLLFGIFSIKCAFK